jgi:hypothetical protein
MRTKLANSVKKDGDWRRTLLRTHDRIEMSNGRVLFRSFGRLSPAFDDDLNRPPERIDEDHSSCADASAPGGIRTPDPRIRRIIRRRAKSARSVPEEARTLMAVGSGHAGQFALVAIRSGEFTAWDGLKRAPLGGRVTGLKVPFSTCRMVPASAENACLVSSLSVVPFRTVADSCQRFSVVGLHLFASWPGYVCLRFRPSLSWTPGAPFG